VEVVGTTTIATVLGISRRAVNYRIQGGKLQAVEAVGEQGRHWRVRLRDVERMVVAAARRLV